MSTVLSTLKSFQEKITSFSKRSNRFTEQFLEKLFSSKNINFKELEKAYNPSELLELKKGIIIYRIKKLRNESAIKIQKMWEKYLNKINVHKLAHHLTGCYTITTESKGMTKVFIKIFYDEEDKGHFKTLPLHFCPIRKIFACDIPKNKFYTSKKKMRFVFLNKNDEEFFDDNYKKVFFYNKYVHEIDFSSFDKNQKITEEAYRKESIDRKKQNESNISTEDEKDIKESLALTSSSRHRSRKFKFDVNNYLEENKEHEEEDEYSGLRAPGCTGTHQVIKRRNYESFELKLKSILKDSNADLLKQRRSIRESSKKVTFGETETICFNN